MTTEEAKIVIRLMFGNCLTCSANLVELFIEHFPEYAELAEKELDAEFRRWNG